VLVVLQVLHMAREVIAAVVRVNDVFSFVIKYSRVSRTRLSGLGRNGLSRLGDSSLVSTGPNGLVNDGHNGLVSGGSDGLGDDRSSQSHRKAALKEENKQYKDGSWFHCHRR